MTYFVVENFGHGLDVRKHILSLPPGALFRAKNCSLNRGGEPESAKAFVFKGTFPPGTHGLMAAGGKLWTFGTALWSNADMPGGVQYQILQTTIGSGLAEVIWTTPIKGKPFVIASFTGGYGVFFNGQPVTDWNAVIVGITTYAEVAANIAAQIQASAIYSAVASGPTITITGRPTIPFSISAAAINGGGVNDQVANVATTQNATPDSAEVLSHGTITISGVTPFPGGIPRYVLTQIAVNGVLQMDTDIMASSDAEAASRIALYINAYGASPEYDAVASGNVVTLTARPGTGAGPNGWAVTADTGFGIGSVMAGGVTYNVPLPQISTVTFGGTFEAADSYAVTLNGIVYTMAGTGSGTSPVAGQRPIVALTKNSKTYAIAGPNLFGSKIGDCTQWNAGTGTFVTDMSSELGGAEILTAMGIYQGNLAIFSRATIQVRYVDPDPANNEQLQVMQNIGTMARKSVVPFGDTDLFFLSDSGLRSLKTRTGTNSATLSDIGSPVDGLVVAAIGASSANASQAVATMEPVDGRFLLQIGTTTYVFNYYPDAKVGGWTTWESGLRITDFAVLEKRLWARADDNLYLLGGENNDTYSQQPMDVKLPFLSARQLATLKHYTALDVVCDGTFDVSISTDPMQPDVEEAIGTVNGSTMASGINPFGGEDVTAIALRFVGRPGKYGRLSSVAVHYQPLKENA